MEHMAEYFVNQATAIYSSCRIFFFCICTDTVFLLITPVDNIYLCCMLYFLFQLEYFLFSFYPSIVCIPFPSSGNFSICFWRQYTSLFASIAAIVFLFLTSDRKSSRCEKHVINVGDRFPQQHILLTLPTDHIDLIHICQIRKLICVK